MKKRLWIGLIAMGVIFTLLLQGCGNPLPPIEAETTDGSDTSAESELSESEEITYFDPEVDIVGPMDYTPLPVIGWRTVQPVIVEWGEVTEDRFVADNFFLSVQQIDEEHSPKDKTRLNIPYVGVEVKIVKTFPTPPSITREEYPVDWDTVLNAEYFMIAEPYLDEIKSGGRALLFIETWKFDEREQKEVFVPAQGYYFYGEMYLGHRFNPITEDNIISSPGLGETISTSYDYLQIPGTDQVLELRKMRNFDSAIYHANHELEIWRRSNGKPAVKWLRDGMTVEEFEEGLQQLYKVIEKCDAWEEYVNSFG